MKTMALSPREIIRGRKIFAWFYVWNTISFQLLSGNIITLYALRLGAGNFLIGLLSAFAGFASIMVIAGRLLVPRMKATTLMGVFWTVRYLLMIPLVFSPSLFLGGRRDLAVVLLVASVLGFNVARGIAVTTFNPLLAEMAGRRDRGEFVSFLQIIINVISPLVGVATALLLGETAPIQAYAVFAALGILCGFGGSYLIFKLPEPREYGTQVSESLFATVRKAFVSRSFSLFVGSLFVVTFVTSMAGPFMIVLMKQVYATSDSLVLIFTVIGGLGALVMALASGLLIDRLGSKPLYFLFTAAAAISVVPMIAVPPLPSPALVWLFAGGIFFLFSMGSSGAANATQTYLLSITSSRENLNLGILYQLVSGVSGTAGAIAGGAFLELLQLGTGLTPVNVYRLFFAGSAALFVLALLLVSGLENIGASSIPDSLKIIFSPRDLRVLSLLRRLVRSSSIAEEQRVIGALAQSRSRVGIEQLLARLESPRFILRAAALEALRESPVDRRVDRALIAEVRRHPFTTSYMAAEMLGERQVREGIRVLRAGLKSQDYFLAGKCMVSLARLGDRTSLPDIASIVDKTENPRLIIHGATALEIFRDCHSVGLLLGKMRRRRSPYLREELILSVAGILGMQEWFYPVFSEFLRDQGGGIARLLDFIESREREMRRDYAPLKELVGRLTRRRTEFAAQARDMLFRMSIRRDGTDLSEVFHGSMEDPRLAGMPRYRFLVAGVILWSYFTPARSSSNPVEREPRMT